MERARQGDGEALVHLLEPLAEPAHRLATGLLHDQRLAVVLTFYLDLPLEEVATVAGISTGAARSRLYRGIARKVGTPVKISAAQSLAQRVAGLFVTEAEAGGIADTQPISPDGALLYLPQSSGLVVISTTSLTTTQVLLHARHVEDVWVSGDGRRLYVAVDGHLAILADGQPPLEPSVSASGFLSASHG